MDKVDVSKVRKIWKEDGKNLKHPNVYFAVYNEKIYYVFRYLKIVILHMLSPKNTAKLRKIKMKKNITKYLI